MAGQGRGHASLLSACPFSSVLRVRLPVRLLPPSLRRVTLGRWVMAAPAAVRHTHDVRPVLERLCEVTDATDDVDVTLHRQREDGLRGDGKLAWVHRDTGDSPTRERWSSRAELPARTVGEGGRTHDPAEGEPGMALDDVPGHVAAVVALTYHSLVSIDLFPEGVLTAHEEEEHGVCGMRSSRRW